MVMESLEVRAAKISAGKFRAGLLALALGVNRYIVRVKVVYDFVSYMYYVTCKWV